MKKLFLIWIFSGSLDGIAQPTHKIFRGNNGAPDTLRLDIKMQSNIDTLRSTLLITSKTPAFCHSIDGFCIQQNGWCTGHLDSRRRVIKLPVKVWGCLRSVKKEDQ
jgi:hypothetical protein